MKIYSAKEVMLCWNPGSDEVAIVKWPDKIGASEKYLMTGLACFLEIHDKKYDYIKQLVFIEAIHLIVRDKCDPMAVHNALLQVQEYRDGLACDMPDFTIKPSNQQP